MATYRGTDTGSLSRNPWLAPPGNDLADDFGTIPTPTPALVRAAQLAVCGRARDVGEARELLAMCGIAPPPRAPAHAATEEVEHG